MSDENERTTEILDGEAVQNDERFWTVPEIPEEVWTELARLQRLSNQITDAHMHIIATQPRRNRE